MMSESPKLSPQGEGKHGREMTLRENNYGNYTQQIAVAIDIEPSLENLEKFIVPSFFKF